MLIIQEASSVQRRVCYIGFATIQFITVRWVRLKPSLTISDSAMTVKVGDKAPLFEALTDTGQKISLSDHIGKTEIVLYFYPKDETPGCTKEACSFRDSWEEIVKLGATVFGVSSDSVDSHKSFKEHHNLPFTLLSDSNSKIREMYGVKGLLIPPRVTFVIDKHGTVTHVYNSQMNPTRHVEEALAALKKLNQQA
jgi:peroxiredoxin Q/BCP